MRRLVPLLSIGALLLHAPLGAQGAGDGRAALRSGDYAKAVQSFRAAVREDPSASDARVGLMQALASTGEYEEAVTVGQDAPAGAPVDNALGEALVRVGRTDEAEAAFRRAASARDAWSLTAEVNLAELLFYRGNIDDAMSRFDRFIDVYNGSSGRLSARDLVAVGRAVRYLGRGQPALFQDALRAFDEAAKADPGWAEPSVRAGDLFLEKYSSPEAKTEYQKVLSANPNHPGALLGLAKALDFDGTSESRATLLRLLDVNPNDVDAHALLAMQALTSEGVDEARSEAEKALAVNPSSLVGLTALAGAEMVSGDDGAFDSVRRRILAIDPHYAETDAALSELAVQTRRYSEAVDRAKAAVALDSSDWEAWGLLGMNELRVGSIEDGRRSLERAFGGDPYNPWFKNSLDLLDTFDRYRVHSTEHFRLFLNGQEDELLATYLAPLAEEAYDSLTRRYGIEPPTPIRAELYPSHADFSVRALGEAGLGALGVSFGTVLVMDSPTARELGEYNWASVFWHELSHSFHLAMSDHRVPRWFSEGLAVQEQRKAREGWGHQVTVPFLQALRGGTLKKVSELDDGFMRPDYPEQVIFSYYEASLVFQVIEDRWGFEAIRSMLRGYGRGQDTEALFQSVLGMSLGDFDDLFDDYLHTRFEKPLQAIADVGQRPGAGATVEELQDFVRAHPGDFIGRMQLGTRLLDDERYDEAEEHFTAALQLFPEYGQADSPYWYLAEIHRHRGELDLAAAALARLNALSESNYTALRTEADVLEEEGHSEESAKVLDRAVEVWPYDLDVHRRLAELHTTVGDFEAAVRERRAVVALAPVDRAEALYQLALAQSKAGDRPGARRTVVQALEIAPNYEDALELLLELRGAGELRR